MAPGISIRDYTTTATSWTQYQRTYTPFDIEAILEQYRILLKDSKKQQRVKWPK